MRYFFSFVFWLDTTTRLKLPTCAAKARLCSTAYKTLGGFWRTVLIVCVSSVLFDLRITGPFWPRGAREQCKGAWFPSAVGAYGTLNIYRNLGETLTQAIREHIVVDSRYSLPVSVVAKTCSSLEGTPCSALALQSTGLWNDSNHRAARKSRDVESIPVIEEALADGNDAERFWTMLADGVSWLVSYEGILSSMLQQSQNQWRPGVAPSVQEAVQHQSYAHQEDVAQLNKRKPLSSSSLPLLLRWFNSRHFIRPASQFLSRLMRTIFFDDYVVTEDSNGDTVLALTDASDAEVHRAVEKNERHPRLDYTSAKQHTQHDGVAQKLEASKLQWKGLARTLNLSDAAGSSVFEYFGSTHFASSPDTINVAVRWVGQWKLDTLVTEEKRERGSVKRRCGVLSSLPQSILFSQPVLVSSLQLYSAANGSKRPQNSFSLVAEGWVWDDASQKHLSSFSPEWFYSTAPLRLLQHRRRAWKAHMMYPQEFLAPVVDQSNNSVLRESVDVIDWVYGSPYQRVDGITFSITGVSTDFQTKHLETSSVNTNLCVASMTIHRPVLIDQKTSHPVKSLAKSGFSPAAKLEAHRPALLLRENSYLQNVDSTSKSTATKTCDETESFCAAPRVQMQDRQQFEYYVLNSLANQQKEAEQSGKRTDVVPPSRSFLDGLETRRALRAPELSSDGVVYNWDKRDPMDSVTVIFQPKLPVEAPVVSLVDLHSSRRVVARRPTTNTGVQYELVPGKTMHHVGAEEEASSSEQVDPDNMVLETMMLKRKFFDAARSAVESAKRLQHVRYQMGKLAEKEATAAGQNEDARDTNKFESEADTAKEQVKVYEDDSELLSELLREELSRSLKQVLEVHQRETPLDSAAAQRDGQRTGSSLSPMDAFKEVTIVEISDRGEELVRRRIRLDTTTKSAAVIRAAPSKQKESETALLFESQLTPNRRSPGVSYSVRKRRKDAEPVIKKSTKDDQASSVEKPQSYSQPTKIIVAKKHSVYSTNTGDQISNQLAKGDRSSKRASAVDAAVKNLKSVEDTRTIKKTLVSTSPENTYQESDKSNPGIMLSDSFVTGSENQQTVQQDTNAYQNLFFVENAPNIRNQHGYPV